MGAHIESIVIFAVLLLNSVVSVIQTKKAEGSLDALKKHQLLAIRLRAIARQLAHSHQLLE
jgi:magnesium-transporting ATPase (P-type)